MGAFVDYLKRDRLTGRLSYRRTYPPELRAFILRSPWELKVSLKTRNYDHQAAAIFSSAASEYDRVVSLARKQAEGTFDKLDEPLIRYLADGYLHDELALDEAGRWKTKIPCPIYESRPDREADWLECGELLEDYDSEGLVAYWQDWACTHATYKGYVLDPTTPEFAHLCRALGEAACKLWLTLDKRIDGIFVATPSPPSLPIASRPTDQTKVTPKGAAMSLQGIAQGLMESSVDKVGQSTIEAWSTALRFFGEVHGSAEPQKITRQMVTEWLELLSQRPSSLPKAERLLALPALVAKYADRVDADRLSKKTLRQHLGSLASIWNKGQEGGFIQEDLPNPFKARKSLAGGSEDDGTEFSVAELQAIFALPIFTSGERPARGKGEACYWLPLMLLWTGVRPEEAAQLLVSDFFQDDDTGCWMVKITDEGVHPVKGPRSLKSSRRTFQVPSPLIDFGLVAYIESLKASGEAALFPQLTVKNPKQGYLFPSFGEWWSLYLKDHDVHLEGKRRRPSRDFRPTWATAARQSLVPEEAMSFLMGHSNARAPTTRRYGSLDAHGLWMNKISFQKLDLSLVKPWSAGHG